MNEITGRPLTTSVVGIIAAVGAAIDILQMIMTLSGKDDEVAQRLCKSIVDKIEELRKGQERLVTEMRFLFAEAKQFQIQLYLESMASEMQGYLISLATRIDEIPHFRSRQGREENRSGLLALRDAAEPHIFKVTATGPAAFQGVVIAYGFLRSIFEALQRTAPDRQVRLEYRRSEATTLKSFKLQLVPFTSTEGDDSVPAQLAELKKTLSERQRALDNIEKRPTTGPITEHIPVHRHPRQSCTRTVVYEHVWDITGSVEQGWTDSHQLITHSDNVHCIPIHDDLPRDPRDRWLVAGSVPEDGEFDIEPEPKSSDLASTLDKHRPSVTAAPFQLASSHQNTQELNRLSAEMRELNKKVTSLEAILGALEATLDAVNLRQQELPRV